MNDRLYFKRMCLLFAISLCIKKQYLWKKQLAIFIALAFGLPIFNLFFLLQQNQIQNFAQFWTFFRIDLFMLIFGLLAIFLYKNIQPIQLKAQTKIRNKLERNVQANHGESRS